MARSPRLGDEKFGERTQELLVRARAGDRSAMDMLFRRYREPLKRWATGRLPSWARDLLDTEDLVQDTLQRVIPHLGTFEPRGEGAFHAYLRATLRNRIREEIRRVHRHPQVPGPDVGRPDPAPSPLEAAIGAESLEAYERALESIGAEDREAIVARIELGMSYREIAAASGKPSADAARMAVSRALVRLAEAMGHEP